jgi:hypothetical protein
MTGLVPSLDGIVLGDDAGPGQRRRAGGQRLFERYVDGGTAIERYPQFRGR